MHKHRQHTVIDERDLNTANNAVHKDSEIGTVSNIFGENQTTCSDISELLLSKFILNLRSSKNISNEKLMEILEQMQEIVKNSKIIFHENFNLCLDLKTKQWSSGGGGDEEEGEMNIKEEY